MSAVDENAKPTTWIAPSARPGDPSLFHAVNGVVTGGVLLVCNGRCANSEIVMIHFDPPRPQRCLRCEADRVATRVRITFAIGDSVDVAVPTGGQP